MLTIISAPAESFDPWVGAGAGYEWLSFESSANGGSLSATAGGFEFGNLQLGGDFAVAPNFGIGPFFTITLAEYRHISGTFNDDLATKSIHSWLIGGVRGVFDIGL